jgi:hypothetical protein
MDQKSSEICVELFKTTFKRFCIVVVFGIAFGYIEAAVVVYLRTIFHPDGFTFPLVNFGVSALWERLLLTEIGREAAIRLFLNHLCRLGHLLLCLAQSPYRLAGLGYGLGHTVSDANYVGGPCPGTGSCIRYVTCICRNNTVPLMFGQNH